MIDRNLTRTFHNLSADNTKRVDEARVGLRTEVQDEFATLSEFFRKRPPNPRMINALIAMALHAGRAQRARLATIARVKISTPLAYMNYACRNYSAQCPWLPRSQHPFS